jgi:hypothetical protein
MIFIFLFYAISGMFHGWNLTLSGLIGHSIFSIHFNAALLGFVFASAAIIPFLILIVYLVKVLVMAKDLKSWTDLYHCISIGTSIIAILSLGAISSLPIMLFSVEAGSIVLFYNLIIISLFLKPLLWFGIRTHLARLEREGKAKFEPGLFNAKTKATPE